MSSTFSEVSYLSDGTTMPRRIMKFDLGITAKEFLGDAQSSHGGGFGRLGVGQADDTKADFGVGVGFLGPRGRLRSRRSGSDEESEKKDGHQLDGQILSPGDSFAGMIARGG